MTSQNNDRPHTNGFAAQAPCLDDAGEVRRMAKETLALVGVAARELAETTLARVRAAEPDADESVALLARLKQELRDAQAGFAAPEAQRAAERAACRKLRLHLICRRESCRKAQACRGNPATCHARANVPEPVSDFVAQLVLAERVPWMRHGETPERFAYEAWIAALEARRGAR